MYDDPLMYPNPDYITTPLYQPSYTPRNNQQLVETILAGIRSEARSVDLYSQLAQIAPQEHKKSIFQALEDKKFICNNSRIYIFD